MASEREPALPPHSLARAVAPLPPNQGPPQRQRAPPTLPGAHAGPPHAQPMATAPGAAASLRALCRRHDGLADEPAVAAALKSEV